MNNKFDIFKNPNTVDYLEITEAIDVNDGYCHSVSEKTEDTKCMCTAFQNSKDTGYCTCGRYYKVENYPIITIISSVQNTGDIAHLLAWKELVEHRGFMSLTISINRESCILSAKEFRNISRAKIAKSDAVVVINEDSAEEEVKTLIDWAKAIGKKIISKGDFLNED